MLIKTMDRRYCSGILIGDVNSVIYKNRRNNVIAYINYH